MDRLAVTLGLEHGLKASNPFVRKLDIFVPRAIETWCLLSRLSKHLLVKSSARPGRSLARPLTRD